MNGDIEKAPGLCLAASPGARTTTIQDSTMGTISIHWYAPTVKGGSTMVTGNALSRDEIDRQSIEAMVKN